MGLRNKIILGGCDKGGKAGIGRIALRYSCGGGVGGGRAEKMAVHRWLVQWLVSVIKLANLLTCTEQKGLMTSNLIDRLSEIRYKCVSVSL